jgi:hypothetical protein
MKWIDVLKRVERFSAHLLVAAAALVGVAIALNGPAAKAVNGVAGIAWLLVAGVLVGTAARTSTGRKLLVAAFVLALVLVLVAKPSDIVLATLGFALGGAILTAGRFAHSERDALMLPALWLPTHLLTAVVRAIDRAVRDVPAHVRTDPPPTAAIVPLVMVACALAGGALARYGIERRAVAGSAVGNLVEEHR